MRATARNGARGLATVVACAVAMSLAPLLVANKSLLAGTAALPVALLVAWLAGFGARAALVVTAGALAALAHAALVPVSFELAGAVALLCVSTPRALRAPTANGRALALALAAVGGALAGGLTDYYADSALVLRLAAAVIAGVVCAAPLLVRVDDPVADALRRAARRLSGPAAAALRDAVVLRRRTADVGRALRATDARRVERAWAVLVDAARAEVRGAGASAVLNERIVAHVAAIERLVAAYDECRVRVGGLENAAWIATAGAATEALESEAAALADAAASVFVAPARASHSAAASR